MSGESYIRQILSADIEHNREVLKLVRLTGRRHDFGLGVVTSLAAALVVGPTFPVTLLGTVPLALLFLAAFVRTWRQRTEQHRIEREAFSRYRAVLEESLEVEGVHRHTNGVQPPSQARTGAQ